MGFRDATLPWKIFYIAFPTFLLAIIIAGICIAFLLKAPGATVAAAYIYCPGYNLTQDVTGVCAQQSDCTNQTDCRVANRGIPLRIVFNVNNPSISTCTMRAEIDVYDETRDPGRGTYLLATSYFDSDHLVPQEGYLGKNKKGQYVAELKLKDSGDVYATGSQITYANSIALIATRMRRSCCPSCPVTTNPDYTDSCSGIWHDQQIRIKGKMHFKCLIEPKVNFEQVILMNSPPIG